MLFRSSGGAVRGAAGVQSSACFFRFLGSMLVFFCVFLVQGGQQTGQTVGNMTEADQKSDNLQVGFDNSGNGLDNAKGLPKRPKRKVEQSLRLKKQNLKDL